MTHNRRRLTALAAVALAAAGVVTVGVASSGCDRSESGCVFEDDGMMWRTDDAGVSWPACATEDANGCWWDAETSGNGEGRSFLVDATGSVTYLP